METKLIADGKDAANKALVRAVVNRNWQELFAALKQGASADYCNWWPLKEAAAVSENVFRELVPEDIHSVPKKVLWECAGNAVWRKVTPLFPFFFESKDASVPLLDIQSIQGRNLIQYLIGRDDVETLIAMEAVGFKWPQVDEDGKSGDMYSLMLSAVQGTKSRQVLVHLCKSGVFARYYSADLVVRYGAWWGDIELLRVALESGVRADLKQSEALGLAIFSDHYDCAKLLIEHGASPTDVDLWLVSYGPDRRKFDTFMASYHRSSNSVIE